MAPPNSALNSLDQDAAKSQRGAALVGKILDKRYVVLEEVGADGKGVRFLVYDMNSLARLHLRIDPEADGQLTGDTFEVVDQDTPLAPAQAEQPRPDIKLVRNEDQAGEQPRPRRPTPKGFATTTVEDDGARTVRMPKVEAAAQADGGGQHGEAAAPQLETAQDNTGATPADPQEQPGQQPEETPLEAALERALRVEEQAAEAKDPFKTTQPIDLATAEEIQEDPPPPKERPRIQTKVLEAAWFAQGDQLDEPEEPEEAEAETPRDVDHAALEQQAAQLSPDEYRRYALDLPPPSPPPAKIVEAFLDAKPDIDRYLEPQPAAAVPAAEPPAPEPVPGAPVAAAEPAGPAPETEPVPAVAATDSPNPAPEPAAAAEPPAASAAPEPAPEPEPVAAAEPAPQTSPAPDAPSKPGLSAAAPLGLPPLDQILPPTAATKEGAAAAPAPEPAPPAVAPEPPASAAEPEPPAPLPEPPAPVPEPLPEQPAAAPVTTTSPAAPAPARPPWATPVTAAGLARRSEPLHQRIIGSRLGTFVIGLVTGGIVAGLGTCMLMPNHEPAASPAQAVAAPSAPVQPQPPAAKPAPVKPRQATAPRPRSEPRPATKQPEKTPPRRRLTGRQRKRLHHFVYMARRSARRHRWKSARIYALRALKLDPTNHRAAKIKIRAEQRLGIN